MASAAEASDFMLNVVAVDVVRRIAESLQVDPEDVARVVPGVMHSHPYRTETPVPGCLYCKRLVELNMAF